MTPKELNQLIEQSQGAAGNINEAIVRRDKLVFEGVIAANSTEGVLLKPAKQLDRNHVFKIEQRMCSIRTTQAINGTAINTPFCTYVDPSPVAPQGNAIPHIDHLRFQFVDDGTNLDRIPLVTSMQFGDAKNADVGSRDWLVFGQREFGVRVFNDHPTQAARVQVVLDGLVYRPERGVLKEI